MQKNDAIGMVSTVEFLKLNAGLENKAFPAVGMFMLRGMPIQYVLGNGTSYAFGHFGRWIKVTCRPSRGHHYTVHCEEVGT